MPDELIDRGSEMAEFRILKATSAGVDGAGKTYVVLYWMPQENVVGYNLYRSKTSSIPMRARPINGRQPIAPVRTCAELKALILPGSKEWEQLVNAFTAVQSRHSLAIIADPNGRAHFADRSILEGLYRRDSLPVEAPSRKVDPCASLARGLTSAEEEMFDALANSSLNFRLARGLAFKDMGVVADEEYYYELRGLLPNGKEITLVTGVHVHAGHYTLPDAPSDLSATAGDRRVLTLWNRNPYAFSYWVRRSFYPIIGYQIIHAEPVRLDVTHDFLGNKLEKSRPGFLDFQRWDTDGLPIDHDVNGVSIGGPENEQTYFYQVAAVDILGRWGNWSAPVNAMPVSSTPPMAPDDLRVDPNTTPLGFMLTWRKVTRDIENHQILEASQSYEIFRGETQAALEDLTMLAGHLVGTATANPTDRATPTLTWTDSDPLLAPPYGEKDFWYRIRCIDLHGNVSSPSAVISGRIPDTTPPGPTIPSGAEGFADHIRIFWHPNSEADIAGYQIYRSICDRGTIYRPSDDNKQVPGCSMIMVGTVSLAEAQKRIEELGQIYFDDFSVPPGSPICYAYWVRAYDGTQNLYPGVAGCPAKQDEYICQRLYEETPPPAPVITALKARNNAVEIEWIAAPIQDLRAFHVYRSRKENDPPEFIGCVLSDGTPYPGRWLGLRPTCGDIPAEPNPTSVHGSFMDNDVAPNEVYWYRVSALDWLGNESEGADLTLMPAISTFTYSSDLPNTPTVLPPSSLGLEGCGLEVRWGPAFDSNLVKGFVIFRSNNLTGDYRQVSPIIADNVFNDISARRGIDYWYRVQSIGRDGTFSPPSVAVKHRY